MSTAGRPTENAPAASDVAGALREAGFVRLVAAAHGDALAAAGVLADGLQHTDVPFQLTVTRPWDRTDRTTDADLTVAIGGPDLVADLDVPGTAQPASRTAFEAVRELDGPAPDPILALAGVVAGDGTPGSLAEIAGLERQPGVAVPTTDPVDGLAHSTLVHTSLSADTDAANELLADIDQEADDAGRQIASALVLDVLGTDAATPRAAERVERVLRPYAGGPFETVGGYADVLDAAAREAPGVAVALALSQSVTDPALDAWRTHAERAHTSLRTATTGRYDGLFVLRDEGDLPVGTIARLALDYRSPEPVVLVVTDGRIGAAATPDAGVDLLDVFRDAFEGAVVAGTPRAATATVETDTADAIMAAREAMQA